MLPRFVLIKGAGDLATGVAHRLYRSGFKVVLTEQEKPTVVRRTVSFAEAVFKGEWEVEGVRARCLTDPVQAFEVLAAGEVPVIVDPTLESLPILSPDVFIEVTLSKRNSGVDKGMAPLVVALGPGYHAGIDVHAVVETARGHYMGRVIYEGEAIPNTGIPGDIGGFTIERLLQAPCDGIFKASRRIGETVKKGEVVAFVDGQPIRSQIDGVLRGLLHDGLKVKKGMKAGDVDPRAQREHCFTISDKARAVAGGVLESILYLSRRRQLSVPFKTRRIPR
ncbi:MAG: selenium-dependent molybdenum cofactor biosynthesis protein YqeB [Dethiobacteria bacterium]|nr:EF2563 family selenium-dependent molybdenum hydroxylase system protein [Bacillota bacterium]